MKRFILMFSCLALMSAGVFAQDADREMPERRAAAGHLIEAMNQRQMMEKMLNAASEMQIRALSQIPCFEQTQDEVRGFVAKYISYDAFRQDLINRYADNFTLAELKDITAFYSTPTGKKILEKMPEILQSTMQNGILKAEAHHKELQDILISHVNKDGTCTPAKKG